MREELLNMSEEELDSLEETVKDAASTVPEIIEGLARKKNGEPQQTIGNCIYVLQRDPLLAKRIRRNELAGYNIIDGDVGWKRRGSLLTNTDMNNLHFYLERNYGLGKVQAIDAAVDIIANENSFNPVIDRLENLHWDGKERIRFALHHFFGADLDAYVGEVMKMHLLAAIHRNYHPGEKYDICLCLVGEQGCGKSTFFRFLALDDNWFSDNVRSPHEKDIYTKLQGHLVIELSEMKAGTRDTDTEEMKAFITRQKDTYRTPYDKYPEDHRRMCVFCATSNDMHFLPFDRSGNRRFAPVRIHPEQREVHILENEKESRAYIEQMWAEAMELYRKGGFTLTFSAEMEEYAKQLQTDFMPEDTDLGLVEVFLEKKGYPRTCVKEIYCEVFNHLYSDKIPISESKKITDILRLLKYTDCGTRKFELYGKQKAWDRKPDPEEDAAGDGFVKVPEGEKLPFD